MNASTCYDTQPTLQSDGYRIRYAQGVRPERQGQLEADYARPTTHSFLAVRYPFSQCFECIEVHSLSTPKRHRPNPVFGPILHTVPAVVTV